jgi:5-methyltetrahydropteroyltriglutamate--homocysteine methyltransferase
MATRILTTHVGSLPGPPGFAADGKEPDDALRDAVAWVVARQREAGIDVVNEGELTKGGDWLAYADGRLAGFEEQAPDPGYISIIRKGRDREQFADFYDWAARRQTLFYADDGRMALKRPFWVCTGPVAYRNIDALEREIAAFRAVVGEADLDGCFLTATAPASLEVYRANAFYKSEEEFLFALADVLAVEYRAIVDAGFLLQVDDAWLVALWDRIGVGMGLDAFRKRSALRMEALNHALSGIPEERVRYHICWGSWHGPHAHDLPMKDVVDLMLSVKARYYLFEAANVRHEHEHAVWRDTPLPDGKVLIPGCVTHSTDLIEHPELVAERIGRFARLVGPERVMAGTDCGFGGRVHPQIAWAKLEALAEGARIASRALA